MTSAMRPIVRSEFWGEAMRLADRHDVPDHETHDFVERACASMAHRAFMRDIEPMTRAKVSVMCLYPTTTWLLTDDRLEAVKPAYPPEVAALLAQLDTMIDQHAKHYGLRRDINPLNLASTR